MLRLEGHSVVAPELPFEDPHTTYRERAQCALDAIAGHEAPVIVGHSLGAGYAPLVADAREDSSLVYLCPAPVGPLAGLDPPMASTRAGFTFPANREDGTSVWEPERALAEIYPRLPADVAGDLVARLLPGASPSDNYPLERPPKVPTAFIYALHDEFFEPAWSRWVAEASGLEPIEIATGHFPMAEAPKALAELLLRL